MPISYTIDRDTSVVHTFAEGRLTEVELAEHKQRLTSDPSFRPGMVELSDVRGVTELDVTPEGIRSFVKQDSEHAVALSDYRLALVVSSEIVFGMARMYEMMTSQNVPHVGVFRDMESARKWLGIDGS